MPVDIFSPTGEELKLFKSTATTTCSSVCVCVRACVCVCVHVCVFLVENLSCTATTVVKTKLSPSGHLQGY